MTTKLDISYRGSLPPALDGINKGETLLDRSYFTMMTGHIDDPVSLVLFETENLSLVKEMLVDDIQRQTGTTIDAQAQDNRGVRWALLGSYKKYSRSCAITKIGKGKTLEDIIADVNWMAVDDLSTNVMINLAGKKRYEQLRGNVKDRAIQPEADHVNKSKRGMQDLQDVYWG